MRMQSKFTRENILNTVNIHTFQYIGELKRLYDKFLAIDLEYKIQKSHKRLKNQG